MVEIQSSFIFSMKKMDIYFILFLSQERFAKLHNLIRVLIEIDLAILQGLDECLGDGEAEKEKRRRM